VFSCEDTPAFDIEFERIFQCLSFFYKMKECIITVTITMLA
jgi:hypothetical protein